MHDLVITDARPLYCSVSCLCWRCMQTDRTMTNIKPWWPPRPLFKNNAENKLQNHPESEVRPAKNLRFDV